jgi:steroid 5-alpha reductase family enzyme
VSPFTATLLVTAVAFAGLWWLGARQRDAGVADAYWGPGFAVIAAVAFMTGAGTDPRRFLVVALVAMWGFRLGGYLWWRRRTSPGEDPRWAALRERAGGNVAAVLALQALCMWIVSFPVQWVVTTPSSPELGFLDLLGFVLWAVGLGFEAMGDLQLVEFRSRAANAGQVLETGLWRYTRHPNYFGDCCVWWAFFLFACATPNGWWTFLGPALMTVLLLRVSGVPPLERRLFDKPGYAAYAARTSPFLPLPPLPAEGGSASRAGGRADRAGPQ